MIGISGWKGANYPSSLLQLLINADNALRPIRVLVLPSFTIFPRLLCPLHVVLPVFREVIRIKLEHPLVVLLLLVDLGLILDCKDPVLQFPRINVF